jgi:hypothetical protein
MALRPIRQELEVNIDHITVNTQEMGGILSFGEASGIIIAEYAIDPNGAIPIGIQLNDIEWVNFSREYYPQRLRRTDVPCGTVGVGMEGEYETDWLHIVGSVSTGDRAYVGPSGTFTNDGSLGNIEVGMFAGPLKSDPHTVVFKGLGFSRQFMDPCTKALAFENNPEDQVLIGTPGYIKIRISQRKIHLSQANL